MTRKGAATQPQEAAPDLVYIVRPGENEELRYSLRSIAQHVRHNRVWIVGTIPTWARHIGAIPLQPQIEKFANQRQSLMAACAHPGVSEHIVLMNDDHFALEPVEEIPVFHLGPSQAHFEKLYAEGFRDKNSWYVAIKQTAAWMTEQGYGDPLCYENHTPLPYYKSKLLEVAQRYPLEQRFCYPGVYPIAGRGPEGTLNGNSKVKTDEELPVKLALDMPWLSTSDQSFIEGEAGRFLREMFPEPGPYEEA